MTINFGNVLMVGCGGTGTEVFKLLIKHKYTSITLLDNERIEITNLNRQYFYTMDDIGKYKSEVLASKAKINSFKSDFDDNRKENARYKHCRENNKYKKENNEDINKNKPIKIEHLKTIKDKKNCENVDTTKANSIIKTGSIYYSTQRIQEYKQDPNIPFDYVFCCLDNIEGRMCVNILNYTYLIDLGVEDDKCHVKKVQPGKYSCLYCIKSLYNTDDYLYYCTVKNIRDIQDRKGVLKYLIVLHKDDLEVEKCFNLIANERGFENTSLFEIKGVRKRILGSACYLNSICASLAFLFMQDEKNDFLFYSGGEITKLTTNRDQNCIVCNELIK